MIAILQKMILPFFDQICMRKDPGSIQTVALSIICNFVAVAWPAAALSGAPAIAREARRPTRGTPEECANVVPASIR